MLADHLDRFVAPEPEALVFANAAGQPLSHSSFQTHHFKKAQLAAGVRCRFHDLRHTSVALAIADGAHPKAIQVRMGHTSITVTLDRYGHLFPELDEAVATAFDARFRTAGVSAAGPATGKNDDR
jgi:integrase